MAQTQWQRAAKKPKMVKVSSQASGGASAVAESGQETGVGFFSGEWWQRAAKKPEMAVVSSSPASGGASAAKKPRTLLGVRVCKERLCNGMGKNGRRTEEGRNRMHLIILESDNWWWLLRRAVAQWRWQSESAVGRLARERLNSRLPHPVQRRRPPFWADTSSRPTRRPA